MKRELIKVPYPVIVEGKYDKIRLSSVIDAHIITTGGFSLFRDKEKIEYLRKLCDKRGAVVVFTDSDGAGLVIRNYLKNVLGEGRRIYNLYTPRVKGKEKRKRIPSKEGVLGVEGIDCGSLGSIFETFLGRVGSESEETINNASGRKNRNSDNGFRQIDKSRLYSDGLSGGEGSRDKRAALCRVLGIPENISAGALIEAINLLEAADIYDKFVSDYSE